VKFDFLGLKTLTVIETARELIARRGITIDPSKLPLDDPAAYALLQRGDTVGVFQLEGQGMRDALRKLRPDRFEDIIAIVALYRPGPMDNIDSYVNRKHGREGIESLHPMIEPILKETYGVIIYQEQVMQIAQVLSGFSLGEADLLRRAMGKKIKKEMAAQKTRFVEGAVTNGVDRARAEYIFELVAKFAGYGFNKSHAAAYALIAYQTAYLKANYPTAFVAASMTLDIGNADKLNSFAQEARRCV
jgi:DNA polymerase-3 subunit alpha